jgi:hypothetical protein
MAEMFHPRSIHRDPADVELVREVTLQEISDWLVPRFEGLPAHLMERIRNLEALKVAFGPIYNEMREGDSIWFCQSKIRADLWGSEGFALVRDGRAVIYLRCMNY